MSAEPRLGLRLPTADAGEFYGAISAVAATTTLDGEVGGNFARAGDAAADTDEAHVGWRRGGVDLSVGAQEYWIGDGLIIGDGNLDTGPDDGQFWNFPFNAWRNSGILRLDGERLRGELFWLRSDRDYGDARVAGLNVENVPAAWPGIFGFTHLEILDATAWNFDGLEVWNLRAHDIALPGLPQLTLWSEVVVQAGQDEDGGGRDNQALGWYVEGAWALRALAWTPVLSYRYIRLSGDDPATPDNEEYRGLFYTFYKREWDTWFNQNQITQMVKLRSFPSERWALTFYYYRHDLDEHQFLGVPLSSTAWADEINLSVEYFLDERFYGYAGLAWSTPDTAAVEFFGSDRDFTVVQTFLMVTF
jgi:hypothetical protein